MKLAAARAIAEVIPEESLVEDYVIPSVFDERVALAVAEPVAESAVATGPARRTLYKDSKEYQRSTLASQMIAHTA